MLAQSKPRMVTGVCFVSAGVRRINSSPAVSPLLEEVFCESDSVSLDLCSGCVQNSSSDDRPSAPTQSSASASEKLHSDITCKYNGLSSRRSSLRETCQASLANSHRSSLNVRFNPQVSVTSDEHVLSVPDEPPTPDGRLVALDAGSTPYTASDPVREQHVSLIEEPTACYSAPDDRSQSCQSGSDWVDGSRVCERLSINAGSTPRRSTKPVVSFLSVGAHEVSGEADSPVGATQWAQALAVAAPAKGATTPTAELGDVDTTPAGSLEEGADGGASPALVEEDDADSHEPEPTPSAMLRLSMDAGHTPAPSRTASMMDALTDSDDGGANRSDEPATALLAPLPAEGRGVLGSETEVPQEAAHLDFNTHGVRRVGRLDADSAGRVSFAANTVDAVTVGSSHAPMAHVITPHVRPCSPSIALCAMSSSCAACAVTRRGSCTGAPEAGPGLHQAFAQHAFIA